MIPRRIIWPPYCGAEFEAAVAGDPVVCGRDHHRQAERHRQDETGFEWWGAMSSYPRTPRPDPEGA